MKKEVGKNFLLVDQARNCILIPVDEAADLIRRLRGSKPYEVIKTHDRIRDLDGTVHEFLKGWWYLDESEM